MLILSNCLTDRPDEGSLVVANRLAEAVRRLQPEATVVSWERKSSLTDRFLKLNKLLLSRKLQKLLRQERGGVLYLPFPTRPLPMAVRVFLLSRMASGQVAAVLSMAGHPGPVSRWLLKASGAAVAVLSRSAWEEYGGFLGEERVIYLKTGVDPEVFHPVSPQRQQELKRSYGLDPGKKVLLHVGHLKEGRNIRALLQVEPEIQVLLAVSPFTKGEWDGQLRKDLLDRGNIRILDEYVPRIQELYQLADAYFFPVTAENNCIDVPLSCLEAAACGKRVVTTAYGEMEAFRGKAGFLILDDQWNRWQDAVHLAMNRPGDRNSVLDYDWAIAARILRELLQ